MKDIESLNFCGSGTVGSKGQIVIPKDLRDSMCIEEGEQMIFMNTPQEGVFVVMKADRLTVITDHLQLKLEKLKNLKEGKN